MKTHIKNTNTQDNANNNTYTENVKEMGKLRYATFQSKPTTTTEIENIIKTLKPKNSYGYDEISTKLLKKNFPFISSSLNYICNEVLKQL
jgi:hypothetical protein